MAEDIKTEQEIETDGPPDLEEEAFSSYETIGLPKEFREETRFFFPVHQTIKKEKNRNPIQKIGQFFRYGSLKFSLQDIQKMIQQDAISEDGINLHLSYYMRQGAEAVCPQLKAIAKLFIEQSRQAGQSAGTQVVLLFKAIDCLRMYQQYSPKGTDNISSFLVLQVFTKMPSVFVTQMDREKMIFNYHLGLQRSLKAGQSGIDYRHQLAHLYVEQKCFSDALYQYEQILEYFQTKESVTSGDQDKICLVHLSLAEFYREIFEFKGNFKNGQIIQNFMFRYYRESTFFTKQRPKIRLIRGSINRMTIRPLYEDLEQIASEHYLKSMESLLVQKNEKKYIETLIWMGIFYQKKQNSIKSFGFFKNASYLVFKYQFSDENLKQREKLLELLRSSLAGFLDASKKLGCSRFFDSLQGKHDQEKIIWEEAKSRPKPASAGDSEE